MTRIILRIPIRHYNIAIINTVWNVSKLRSNIVIAFLIFIEMALMLSLSTLSHNLISNYLL